MGDNTKPMGDRMGTITTRERADGSVAYRAEVVTRHDGKRHKHSATFDRESAAKAWIKRKEKEVRSDGYHPAKRRVAVTVGDAIDRYVADHERMGKTKAQCLRTLRRDPIADVDCRDVGVVVLSDLIARLGEDKQPQTVGNYMSHLGSVLAVARDAWEYPIDADAMKRALKANQRLGTVAKSRKRDRRPTVAEMDRLVAYFRERRRQADAMPMDVLAAFAMFSTRRQEEICRITWADLDVAHSRVLVRDMKHPGEKIGNNVWCELPPEALRIIEAQPCKDARIFPFNQKSVSTAFTRATKFLGIVDLHFHDLRHEGVSRLFELGRTIPQAASVSGHRSWQSLQRYSHIRATGDRWGGWLGRTFPEL